ncbi:hypothetical protein Bca101_067365 [Brassica carinata]
MISASSRSRSPARVPDPTDDVSSSSQLATTAISSDLTSESSTVATFDIRGIPAKCVCRTKTTIYTEDTDKNPGRPFYNCLT